MKPIAKRAKTAPSKAVPPKKIDVVKMVRPKGKLGP
jgi:hypothetical protein